MDKGSSLGCAICCAVTPASQNHVYSGEMSPGLRVWCEGQQLGSASAGSLCPALPGLGFRPARKAENLPAMKETGFNPWVGKFLWRTAWPPTAVFLCGESHDRGAWRATARGVTESDTSARLTHSGQEKAVAGSARTAHLRGGRGDRGGASLRPRSRRPPHRAPLVPSPLVHSRVRLESAPPSHTLRPRPAPRH